MTGVSGMVSVVIPFFNPTEQFLREAVESIMSQRFRAWEIILVDDGSEDCAGTRAARAIGYTLGNRVRLVTYDEPGNRGASAARNEGLRHTNGEYVAFLDADDLWLPDKLRIEVSALDAHPSVGMVYSSYLYWYSWTKHEEDATKDWVPALGTKPDTIISPPKLLTKFLRGAASVPTPSCVLFRKQALTAVGGWEASFPGLYDDQVLFAKVGLRFPVLPLDALTTYYRQHRLSICATSNAEAERAARVRFLSWLDSYLETGAVVDRELHAILRKEVWKTRNPRGARALRWARKLAQRLDPFHGGQQQPVVARGR